MSDNDEHEIAIAIQAAELSARQEVRSHFTSSWDLVHRLFVCIAGKYSIILWVEPETILIGEDGLGLFFATFPSNLKLKHKTFQARSRHLV